MPRGIKNIAGTDYTYFRTYQSRKVASDRQDQIENHKRKVMLIEREPYPLFDIWVELKLLDKIALGIFDGIRELLQPPWRIPERQRIRPDEMILK